MNASAACWGLYAELVGFELGEPALVGRLHQLTVDAYGAQHGGPDPASLRVAYSLVGLCLAIERGWSGAQVRGLHQRMGRRKAWWPLLPQPSSRGLLTVADVVAAGARRASVEGHARLVPEWATSVWETWRPQHAAIAAFTDRLVTS